MSVVQQFDVGGVKYNVARASAVQQDEVLSLLANELAPLFASEGIQEIPGDEFFVNYFTSLDFMRKQKIDALLLSQFSRNGESVNLSIRDFDGRLMDLQQLRAKVLKWNLEPFFAYWASAVKLAIEKAKAAAKKAQ